ncbi:MAG TPA: ATP-binding protein [Candidatus Binataceae bacterium]
MSAPTLRNRVRNGTLVLLALVVMLGAYTLPRIYRLGGAIRQTLYRNYVSIEAAQQMQAALRVLQVAGRDGKALQALPKSREQFIRGMDTENHDFTEIGEPELAHQIEAKGVRLFGEVSAAPTASHDREYDELYALLDDLIAMNKAAMFRANSRSEKLGRRLTYEFASGLAMVLLVGAALSWWFGWVLSQPLIDVAERLRGVSQRHTHLRLGPQKLAELEAVAREFNEMAERLEQYDRLNVERLVYEKSKTEAIIESLEDGVVLIDSQGIVVHMNEIASLIMGVEPREALGSPFDDLNTNHPHYLRIREALNSSKKPHREDDRRIEVELHVRGRDHSYLIKPMPLTKAEGQLLGTLLILQDVTYLRDQDRARTNLVATLSHELRTPLTSMALAAELLSREDASLTLKQREFLQVILEDCSRMRQLTDNLLNLARGDVASISVRREKLDLAEMAKEVTKRFAIQAADKQIRLETRIEEMPEVRGDPVKLSWVISNLLGNAIRYTPQGGSIEVVARRADGSARLEVADSGPGIAPELQDYVFERFAQYGSNGFEKGAAGLGLSIVKDIVEAHGGRIFLESNQDHGSRFIVELPGLTGT